MTDGPAQLQSQWDALVSMIQAPPSPEAEQPATRVPVTVVGGFLGAGKTTLLRHLLTSDHGLRLSVVVNDLGAINIDNKLLASVAGERIELSNGCSCCTLGPDLAQALVELAGRTPAPDAIIIEASGVGDPTGIATVVEAERRLRLDGIITVVDATSLTERLAEPLLEPLLRRQLDAAHLIAMSRPDQLTSTERAEITGRVASLAPGRPVIPLEQGCLDPQVAISAASRGARPAPTGTDSPAPAFATSTLELPSPIARAELISLLENLTVVRAKGFVELVDAPGRSQLIQVVGRNWTVDDWGPLDQEHQPGRLVTISLPDQV